MSCIVKAENLIKEFKLEQQSHGFFNVLAGAFKRTGKVKRAVDDISFEIDKGEFIGYIGPNGAGKSTTIKMLTGILVPSSGSCLVNGVVPYRDRKRNAKKIGVVFGQRSQLWWDLPIEDTYRMLAHMYDVRKNVYNERIKFLSKLLGLEEFWEKPVRQLSLGQRMRGELGASLIHMPEILYLDEPTIGMDSLVKENIRMFLAEINRKFETTIILTTHDLDDIERLCSKVIVINHGKILFNGTLDALKLGYGTESQFAVEFIGSSEKHYFPFKRDEMAADELLKSIVSRGQIKDIRIQEPMIEDVIKSLYQGAAN